MLLRKTGYLLATLVIFLGLYASPRAAYANPVVTGYLTPTVDAGAYNITNGPDGAMWFTEERASKIGRIDTSGTITEYALPSAGLLPYAIALGPDGALWFTEVAATGKVGRITVSGSVTQFSLPPNALATSIVTGPDGALWFTDYGNNAIGRITISGVVTEYSLAPFPNAFGPQRITAGPDGALWFSDGSDNVIRITTAGEMTIYSVYPHEPLGITSGPDGRLWLTDLNHNGVFSISTTGEVGPYYSIPVPGTPKHPAMIVTGPDGALWFTESSANAVGRITTAGSLSEYPISSLAEYSGLWGIVAGPDGAIWTVSGGATGTQSGISRITTDISPTAPADLTATTPAQTPSLSWTAVSGATSYSVYRDGSNVGSSTVASYADTTAADGAHSYYVTSVNGSGESGHSNEISVLRDSAKPTISYALSPSPNTAGWNNANVTVTFTCNDTLSGIATCTSPVAVNTQGANQTVTGTAVDNAGNTMSTTATIKLDKTVPGISAATVQTGLIIFVGNQTVSATTSDSLSGIGGGEYFLTTTNTAPTAVPGTGTSMAYGAGKITASFSASGNGIHYVWMRSRDAAGNWSAFVRASYRVIL